MERNIPDVRNIFGRQMSEASCKEQLRSYEYSPRSRRRGDHVSSQDYSDCRRQQTRNSENRQKEALNGKRPSRPRDVHLEDKDPKGRGDENQKHSAKQNRDTARYSTRTLTERDIRHLERHLSMKKTIRKQISRNLAQAFVEDPEIIMKEGSTSPAKEKPSEKSITLTRAKLSRSEQNVLELLKDNETDSGHCSADNHCSSDDEDSKKQFPKSEAKRANDEKQEILRSKKENPEGKFSFWKMFSVKTKGKR